MYEKQQTKIIRGKEGTTKNTYTKIMSETQ